ncbi:hypothetical protein M378DRAFT_779970 [Amanita muscaria Koide BX008]|uniref:Uncharacterized protein n=1 Tax=Amanita muscaria (strain Koide BX008) TaxID=946122 RepID=A0A0C2T0K0_AMAMK|nr:hypothetical protein M378DRAFT_779970 [Amanita muscaria Koide BX008]
MSVIFLLTHVALFVHLRATLDDPLFLQTVTSYRNDFPRLTLLGLRFRLLLVVHLDIFIYVWCNWSLDFFLFDRPCIYLPFFGGVAGTRCSCDVFYHRLYPLTRVQHHYLLRQKSCSFCAAEEVRLLLRQTTQRLS